jgi:hypothetical protein
MRTLRTTLFAQKDQLVSILTDLLTSTLTEIHKSEREHSQALLQEHARLVFELRDDIQMSRVACNEKIGMVF